MSEDPVKPEEEQESSETDEIPELEPIPEPELSSDSEPPSDTESDEEEEVLYVIQDDTIPVSSMEADFEEALDSFYLMDLLDFAAVIDTAFEATIPSHSQ